MRFADGDAWRRWLVTDQRAFADRPDVLTYSDAGADRAAAHQRRTGRESRRLDQRHRRDWVVKLIDVYPDEVPSQPEMGGYQLARGAWTSSAAATARASRRRSAIVANTPLPYRFVLPTANHVFLPGHRMMVQVQSTWFPLYDRNPQTFVPNIFFAQAGGLREGDAARLSAPGRRPASSSCRSCRGRRESSGSCSERW